MARTIVFSDAHLGQDDPRIVRRVEGFLDEVCSSAGKVHILGDFFDFWFGPMQARTEPYARVLEKLGELAASGVEVVFYHGNRDFYIDDEIGGKYGFEVVDDYRIEEMCGKRVLMCHGDRLCSNDTSYHIFRAILRSTFVRRMLKVIPVHAARTMAKLFRAHSKRAVAGKSQWVLGIDDGAVMESFALGADAIILGHTHRQNQREFETDEGVKTLYALGDFGTSGSYIECGEGGLRYMKYAESPSGE